MGGNVALGETLARPARKCIARFWFGVGGGLMLREAATEISPGLKPWAMIYNRFAEMPTSSVHATQQQ